MENRKGPVSIFFRLLKAISRQNDLNEEQGPSNIGEPSSIDDGSANEAKAAPRPPDLGATKLEELPANATEIQNLISGGEYGNDALLGGYSDGNDVLLGGYGEGNDVLLGGYGNDSLNYLGGDNVVYDSRGNNISYSGGGSDTLFTDDGVISFLGDDNYTSVNGLDSYSFASRETLTDGASLVDSWSELRGEGTVHRLERDEALALARKGREAWNDWADSHQGWSVNLGEIDFTAKDNSSIQFNGFKFPGAANFDISVFGPDASFGEAIFRGRASFKRCMFNGKSDFLGANFLDQAIFTEARFGGMPNFVGAHFRSDAFFENVIFLLGACFRHVHFWEGAQFGKATFIGYADFEYSSFYRPSNFSNAEFDLAVGFRFTNFHERAEFWNLDELNADFHGAELRNSGIGQPQVDSSQGDEETQLPDDIIRPEHWLNEKPSSVASDDEEERDATSSEDLPTIPDQMAGISFRFSENGKVSLASSGPASRNELSEIAPIRAVVVAAIEDLLSALKGSNAHGALVDAAELYAGALTGDPLSIDQLYAFGMRLENSHARLKRDIESGDIPAMSAVAGEALDTVLGLHGVLIAGTGRGRQLLEDAEKYYQSEATSAQLKSKAAEYKTRALEFANVVVNEHELVDDLAGEVVVSANKEIGEGTHPGRTTQNARAINQNLLRTVAAVSVTFVAAPVIGGAFAESIPGTIAGEALTITTDACWNFFIANRPVLYDFALVAGKEMAWLIPFLDWIERAYQIRQDGKEK